MSWYLRAIEQADGSWVPRFGLEDLPVKPDETSLLMFLATAATALGGRHLFRFYLHRQDGRIDSIPGTAPVPDQRHVSTAGAATGR